jgi:hypothetical protein
MRNVFGPKINEATGDWKKINNLELRDVFLSNIIWEIK